MNLAVYLQEIRININKNKFNNNKVMTILVSQMKGAWINSTNGKMIIIQMNYYPNKIMKCLLLENS